jgi:hypothetical protein
MKAVMLISGLTAVVVTTWVVASSFLGDRPTPGPNARMQVAYSFPATTRVVVEYEPAGGGKVRGLLDYCGGRLRSASWYNTANRLELEQTFTQTFTGERSSSTAYSHNYWEKSLLVSPQEPCITFHYSSVTDISGVSHESKEWSYAGELLAREEPGRYSDLLPVVVSGLVGLVGVALWAAWRYRKKKASAPQPASRRGSVANVDRDN